jgi:hypothetical protein
VSQCVEVQRLLDEPKIKISIVATKDETRLYNIGHEPSIDYLSCP